MQGSAPRWWGTCRAADGRCNKEQCVQSVLSWHGSAQCQTQERNWLCDLSCLTEEQVGNCLVQPF